MTSQSDQRNIDFLLCTSETGIIDPTIVLDSLFLVNDDIFETGKFKRELFQTHLVV
jgi:hypothetical protein